MNAVVLFFPSVYQHHIKVKKKFKYYDNTKPNHLRCVLLSEVTHKVYPANSLYHSVPGSISSCDAFLNVFQNMGLRSEVICPCAGSPEALTVALRRYKHTLTLSFAQETHMCSGICFQFKLIKMGGSVFCGRTLQTI